MLDRRARSIVCGAAALAAATAARAGLDSLETQDLRLLYRDPLQTYLVEHVGRCFTNSLQFEHRLVGYTPSQRITVILNDYSDAGNASATAVPRNFLSVETAPLSNAYETVTPNERMNWLMNHELVHITMVDQAAKADRRARAAFGGKVMPVAEDPESILWYDLTVPRDAAPRWYHEGIAVFIETWMAGGQGRAQGAYDEMVFRSMVRDGSHFYDPLGLVAQGTKIDFQVEVNSYLYGTRFMTYLAYRYSPEMVIRWVSRPDGSAAYYAKNFQQVFGIPLGRAWSEWIAFEKQFQETNLAAIRKYPTTRSKDLSARALGSVSRAYLDRVKRKLYVAFSYPGLVAHVGSISLDDGAVRPIVEVKNPVLFTVTSLAWDPDRRLLFYTTDNREYRDILSLDPDTGRTKTLLKDARIGALAFDRADRSLWGVRHFNGIATLVRVPYPYTSWTQVYSFPYGVVPYDLDVSPDGTFLSAGVGGIDGLHELHLMKIEDLLGGKMEPVAHFEFGTFLPLGFIFSDDGRYLYGSSYYTGVSNVFRYEIASGKLDALTNAETGFFHPVPRDDGSMIVFRYSGDGFVPAVIDDPKPLEDVSAITFLGAELVEKHPVVKEWQVGSPAKIDLDALTTRQGPYRSFQSVASESFYPIVEGYQDTQAVGMRFNFSDPLQLNRFTLNASYSPSQRIPSNERYHLRLQYRRYDWHVEARLNAADFYDLFGPTKTSRKGHALLVGWDHGLVYDPPRRMTLAVNAAYYGNLDQLPQYQNVASPSDRLAEASVRLRYENVRSSLGHVDDEKGQRFELWSGASLSRGKLVPQAEGTYDVGFQLPLRHSSIWLRNAAGIGFGEPDDPFAQFYFGAFGNNWVDHREEHRYRESYAFPGLDLNEIGGRTFGKAILEWNLPPARFEHFGTPGFYATWMRPSLFVGGLRFGRPVTDVDGRPRQRSFADAGTQLDFRFTILSRLDMTLSLGYAAAFERGAGPRREAMVSLKVMQ
jgi:hypothetical protein